MSELLKKIVFLYVFDSFLPFYTQEQITHFSFLKSDLSELLLLLFTKKQQWAIRSGLSWQKNDGSDLLFRSQKTSESLKKPISEFPTLIVSVKESQREGHSMINDKAKKCPSSVKERGTAW